MGGIDLAFGRWDNECHVIADDFKAPPQHISELASATVAGLVRSISLSVRSLSTRSGLFHCLPDLVYFRINLVLSVISGVFHCLLYITVYYSTDLKYRPDLADSKIEQVWKETRLDRKQNRE